MNTHVAKLAASSLVLALGTVACTPNSHMARPFAVSAKLPKAERGAAARFAEAEKALARNDVDAALPAAEDAVRLSPTDVAYRMLLADIYLKKGRFASAEAAFADALSLHPDNKRAAMSLVLVEIAQGKSGIATLQLEHLRESHPVADIGLAYALAGQPERAVALLEAEARGEGADGRVRQNLALAYALAGDWQKARITAAQDLGADEVEARMRQWAAFATPGDSMGPIAGLLGVTPAAVDPGQPTALALVRPDVQPAAAFAEAAPDPVPAPVELAEAPLAADVETQIQYAAAAENLVSPAPVIKAAILADPSPAFDPFSKPARIAGLAQKAKPAASKAKAGPSAYVVQIGAYRSANMVAWAWSNLRKRYDLGNGAPLSTSIDLPGKGRFYRLSVAGFDTPAEAAGLCRAIKSRKGACFVRTNGGDTPTQWALRGSSPRAA